MTATDIHPTIQKIIDEPLFLAHMLGYDKVKTSIHEDWIKEVWRPGDSLLLAHRNSYKTTTRVISVIRGLLIWPDTRIVIIRKNKDEASKTVAEIMQHYERPALRTLYKKAFNIDEPRNTNKWASSKGFNLVTKNSVTTQRNVEPAGIGKHKTGSHYDVIIADDIVTIEDRYSYAERENTKTYIKELQNILNTDGIGIKYSGTPWHEDDAYQLMPKPDKVYPVSMNFIEDMTKGTLSKIRDTMQDDSMFQANYYLEHVSSEDRPFTNPQFAPVPEGFQPFAYLDPAFGDKKINDYSALTIGAMNGNEILISAGYIWKERLDITYTKVPELCYRNNVSVLFVEANQAQIAVAMELSKGGLETRTINQYKSKHLRILHYARKNWPSIRFSHELEQSDYLKQILAYIDPQYSAHDDAPDSLAGLIQCLTGDRKSVKMGYIRY